MRKIGSYFIMVIALISMVSCAPKHDKTIANLKAAIDGESTASAKYAAFAEQAAKDSLFMVEALFKATSQAEAIHAQKYQTVLASLGVMDYTPTVQPFEVKTTAENLQAAINGEADEFTEIYPKFIKEAEAETMQDAIVAFNYAQEAEKGHARIYSDVLTQLTTTPEAIASIYYVCQVCGNTYAGTPSAQCELCQTPSEQFIVFEASAPVVETEVIAEN